MIEQFTWTADSADRMGFTDRYEPIQPFLFLEFARAIKVTRVADVGANVGFYSLIATTLPDVQMVVGFEPAPECHVAFKKNVVANGLEGVITPVEKAASDGGGKRPIRLYGKYAGINSLEAAGPGSDLGRARVETIESTTLDNELDWRDQTIAIKVDVEGHEMATLAGARDLLSRNTAVVQVEFYNNRAEVIEEMGALGYRLIFEVRRDLYFTNALALGETLSVLACVQCAADCVVENSQRRILQIPRNPKTLWRFLRKKPFHF